MPDLIVKPNALRSEIVRAEIIAGTTIREALGNNVSECYRVALEGELIPREKWEEIELQEHQQLTVYEVPQNDTAISVLRVVAIAVVSYYSFGVLGPAAAGASGASATGLAATFYGATFSAIGVLAVNALIPLPTPDTEEKQQGNKRKSLTGTRNVLSPFAPIPKVLGNVKFYPPLAANFVTEVAGPDQFLRILLCLGYGPLQIGGQIASNSNTLTETSGLTVGAIKIGDTNIESFTDFEYEIGTFNNISLYTQDITETAPGTPLDLQDTSNNEDTWFTDNVSVIRTTTVGCIGISVDITFPTGLWTMNEEGEFRTGDGVTFSLEYSIAGQNNWTFFGRSGLSVTSITVSGGIGTATTSTPHGFKIGEVVDFLGSNVAMNGLKTAINTVPSTTTFTFNSSGATSDNPSTAKVHLVVIDSGKDTVSRNYTVTVPSNQYDVRVTRIESWVSERAVVSMNAIWTSLRSIKAGVAWNDNTTLLMAVRIKATDQLNGLVDKINVLAQSVVPIWNGGNWNTFAATSNPASLYRDALIGPQLQRPIPSIRIDDAFGASLPTWYNWCVTNNVEYNFVHDGRETLLNRLKAIAATGNAAWALLEGKFGVIQDTLFPVPIQVFSPRNSWGFSAEKIFLDLPHAVNIKYIDNNVWEEDTITVYRSGFNSGNATKFEEISTQGVTDQIQAWKLGQYFFRQAILRPEVYTVNVDIENIIATRGDTVRIANDVIKVGLFWGRITDLPANNQVTLDEEITFEPAKTYGIVVRKQNATQVTYTASNSAGIYNTINLTTIHSGLSVGDLVLFGEITIESINVKIQNIIYDNGLNATLTLIDEAPTIYNYGSPPVYNPRVSNPAALDELPPPLPNLNYFDSGTLSTYLAADGSMQTSIMISFNFMSANLVPVDKVDFKYRLLGTVAWLYMQFDAATGSARLINVQQGLTYEISARSLSSFGKYSSWTNIVNHTVVGKSIPLNPPTLLTTSSIVGGITLTWTNPLDFDLSGIEIWVNSINDRSSASIIGFVGKPSNSRTMAVVEGGIRYYWLRAFDSRTNALKTYSAWEPVGPTSGVQGVSGVSAGGGVQTYYQNTAPVGASEGDLWFDLDDSNKAYRYSSLNIWELIRDTDISIALSNAAGAQSTADGKIVTFYQTAQPLAGVSSLGDIWFDTGNGNNAWRYNGSNWIDVQDAGIPQAINDASSAQATADGKIITFFAITTSPPTTQSLGDLWYQTDTLNLMRWNNSVWELVSTNGATWGLNVINSPLDISNMILRPNFEDGLIGLWTGGTVVSFGGQVFSKGLQSGTTRIYEDNITPSRPSDRIFLSAMINNANGGGSALFGIAFLDNAGFTASIKNITAVPAGQGWTAVSGWVDAGFNTAGIKPTFIVNSSGTAIIADLYMSRFEIGSTINRIYSVPSTATPSNAVEGDLWYQTDKGLFMSYVGGSWGAVSTNRDVYFQTTAPVGTFQAGDIWIDSNDANKMYRYNGSIWELVRDSGIAQALTSSSAAQATADGKIVTFYQTSAPSSGNSSVGDIWFDTNDNNKVYRYHSTLVWVLAQDLDIPNAINSANNAQSSANSAQATADGKVVTFIASSGSPPTGQTVGDLWYRTDRGDVLRFNGSSWSDIIANIRNVFFVSVEPDALSGRQIGDLWIDSANDNQLKRWNAFIWVVVRDAGIQQALDDAALAKSTADGKIDSFWQTNPPINQGELVGDIWFDTNDGNNAWRYNGSNWIDVQDAGIPQAINDASSAQATADGKIITFFAITTSPPTAAALGDLWYQTDTKELRRWNLSNWNDIVSTQGATWGTNIDGANLPDDNADVTGDTTNSAGGLLPNWNLDIIDSALKPAGIRGTYSVNHRLGISFLDAGNDSINITYAGDNAIGYGFPVVPIDDKQEYTVTIRHKTDDSTPPTTGLYLRMMELNTFMPQGKTHIGAAPFESMATQYTNFKDVSPSNGQFPGTSWTMQTYTYTPTIGTQFASFNMLNFRAQTLEYHVDAVQIRPTQKLITNINVDDFIADQAVTKRDFQYSTGAVLVPGGATPWDGFKRTLATATLAVSTGEAVFVDLSFLYYLDSSFSYQLAVRLLRGSTVLWSDNFFDPWQASPLLTYNIAASLIDQPVAGTHIYTLEAWADNLSGNGMTTYIVQNRLLKTYIWVK